MPSLGGSPSMNMVKMALCSSTGTEGIFPGEDLAGQAGEALDSGWLGMDAGVCLAAEWGPFLTKASFHLCLGLSLLRLGAMA